MAKYSDTDFCDNCNKETLQEFTPSEHERDSSGDIQTCLTCGWSKSGYSDEWWPPENDPDELKNEENA